MQMSRLSLYICLYYDVALSMLCVYGIAILYVYDIATLYVYA